MSLVEKRPAPSAARPFRFPAVTRTKLSNGLSVVACDTPGRPMAAAEIMFEAGAFNEAAELSGVAALAANAVTEGTEGYPGVSFAKAAESLGADLDASGGWETIAIDLSAPVSRLEQALELQAEVARRPLFPEEEIERHKAERLNRIKQQNAQPLFRALRGFRETIFSSDSPYRREVAGDENTVPGLTRAHITDHYGHFATPGSATLVVVGDLEMIDVASLAEKLYGDWRAQEPPRPRAAVTEAIDGTAITIVNRPGSVQSNFALGHIGIARSDADYLAVELMNHSLGGSFSSRINQRLREEKGYTYGARSMFDARRAQGMFLTYAPVETSVTADAVADAMGVIRTAIDGGFTQEELDEARDHETGVFSLRFEVPAAIANGLIEIALYGLPDDYFDTYGPTLQNLTVADIDAAARARLHPDRTAIIVVGDAEKIAGPLEQTKIGPVTVIEDPDA